MRKSKTQTERGSRPFIQLDVEARVYPDATDKTSVRVLTHAVQGEKGGEWFAEAERRLHSFIEQYIKFFEYNETIHAFWEGAKEAGRADSVLQAGRADSVLQLENRRPRNQANEEPAPVLRSAEVYGQLQKGQSQC